MNAFPVLLFAAARDLAGTDRLTLHLPAGATVADLVAALAVESPALAPLLPRCRVAVNHAFADSADAVSSGDELALIPPVSGG